MVAYLGELKPCEQSGWAQLGRTLSAKDKPRRSLFDPPHYDDPSDDEPVLVRLQGVRLERLRDFGDVWMPTPLRFVNRALGTRGRAMVQWMAKRAWLIARLAANG